MMAPHGPGSRIWRSVPCHARQQSSPPTGEAVECKDPHLHGRSSGSGSRVREAGGPEVRFWEVASITVLFSLLRLVMSRYRRSQTGFLFAGSTGGVDSANTRCGVIESRRSLVPGLIGCKSLLAGQLRRQLRIQPDKSPCRQTCWRSVGFCRENTLVTRRHSTPRCRKNAGMSRLP